MFKKIMHRRLYNSIVVKEATQEQLVRLVHYYRWTAVLGMYLWIMTVLVIFATMLGYTAVLAFFGGDTGSHASFSQVFIAFMELPLWVVMGLGGFLIMYVVFFVSTFMPTYIIACDWVSEWWYGSVRRVEVRETTEEDLHPSPPTLAGLLKYK